MKLGKHGFERACEFIKRNARPLDLALYLFYFEEGSEDDILKELKQFQNEDGGFGHAIESDFRLRASSPMATSVAIQYYHKATTATDQEMIRSAIRYLVSTYDSKSQYWPATFEDVNEEPHAPWWHVKEFAPPKGVDWANPSAELAGYLNKYSEYVPRDLLTSINKRVSLYLEEHKIIGSWLYNIMCWNRVYEFFPEPIRLASKKAIVESFQSMLPLTLERLGEIQISWLAPTPESILNQIAPDVVHHYLDLTITEQADDGGWWPAWKWGQYPETWPVAELEWAGKMTVACLKTLKDYDLIEGL